MRNALFADIGRCAKCSQVRTHQAGEVYYDTAYRKGKCQPAITGDTLRTAPVWRCMNQIPGCQPNADVRDHAQEHGNRRQGKSQESQVFVTACIAKQNRKIAFLFFFHNIVCLLICKS